METYKGTTLETRSIERYGNPTVDENKYKKTAYQYLKNENKGSLENVAFSFLGNKVLYGDFFEKIGDTAKALTSMGLKKGDRVAALVSDTPESAYIQYAANRLGIVCDFIDPRTKPATLVEILKNEDVNSIIVLDVLADDLIKSQLGEIASNTNVKKVLTVPVLLSAPSLIYKLSYLKSKLGKKEKIDNCGIEFYDYVDAINNSKYQLFDDVKYESDSPAIITHTSGSSTGIPSPIVITNENMNSIPYQHELAGLCFSPSKKLLHILPYFAAYGSACCTHMGLSFGMELQELAQFDVAKLGRMIYKYKPNIVFGTPSWFLAMAKDKYLENADFSFLECLVVGGGSLSNEEEIFINKWLINHKARCLLTKGYGLSEISGCGTYTNNDSNNKIGFTGIPLPLTEIGVVDPVSKKLVYSNEKGEFIGEAIVSGPSVISQKLNPVKDDKFIILDGKKYFLTGDTVLMDSSGNLKHIDRLDRTFGRFDGYKIHPGNIEMKIKNYGIVEDCAIVPYFSDEKSGNMPLGYVACGKKLPCSENELIETIIQKMLEDKTLTTRDIPSKWIIMDKLPLNGMSKTDFNLLKRELPGSDESIDLYFNESNLGFSYKFINEGKKLKIK